MRKYVETLKLMFKTQIAYRFDIITSMIFTISKILLAYVLWGAIFGQQQVIGGFTFHSMLSYYIISSFILQLDQSSSIGWQIAREIRNGGFSKYMIRPMGIFGYFTSQTVGVSSFLLLFNLIAATIWIFIFRINFVFQLSPLTGISVLLLILLGLLFMIQINYFLGILAFKFLDTSMFLMIKDNIVQFVTGALIPLTLLPTGILHIMTIFPFYYISYLPSMLLLGRNEEEILPGVIVISLWNVVLKIIISVTYKRLKSSYDGVGI